MRVLLFLAVALATANAATRVAVIELGASGTVRRTTAVNEQTSAEGVASFWSALHGYGRKLQHAGMTVVPDLFSRPESGLVVGLTGVDLDNMPNLNGFMTAEEGNGVVGHMEVHGQACNKMMRNIKNSEEVQYPTLSSTFESKASEAGISALQMAVTTETANDVDMQLASLIQKADEEAKNSGKTVVLHLIVEEDDGAARRRHLARRLEDAGQQDGQQDAEGDQQQDNGGDQQEDAGDQQDADAEGNQQFNGYYGYGYYNAYGEWVTPYKTMFQIQYFNVVLWTSIGLVGTLFFSLYLFVYMPLMADTLLFGESAKVAHDD